MKTNNTKAESVVSIDQIVILIKEQRDQQISELFKEEVLMAFLEEHFDSIASSKIKLEFLKRDLKEIMKSSLDLAFYSPLIKQMKETGLMEIENHPIILLELNGVFKKYGFEKID